MLFAMTLQVHELCRKSAGRLLTEFKPQLIIAIGGGGFIPARILRSFLRKDGSPNIPIQAIGLSLYESLGDDTEVEKIGKEVKRTQWLDFTSLGTMKNLIGKRILIVDEVDDSRTTLAYAVKELEKDVEAARQEAISNGMADNLPKTEFYIFVLHVRHFFPPQPMQARARINFIIIHTETDHDLRHAEQGQKEGWHLARRHAGQALRSCRYYWRRLDQLPLGGARHC